jgi:sugar O-acyltransferase (sialic acid O-acetyltransferase NeuD family)
VSTARAREPLVILGVGGHGREMLSLLDACNADGARYEVLGFVDDAARAPDAEVHGLPVLGTRAWLAERGPPCLVVLGVGASAARVRLSRWLADASRRSPTLVHPTAVVGRGVRLGDGVVVTAACVVTTDVALGPHTHLNVGASVSHDGRLGACVTLAPGVRLAGNVTLGDGCDVGVGAVCLPGVRVGEHTIVGAGAVVTRDLPARVVAAGVPARVLRPIADA